MLVRKHDENRIQVDLSLHPNVKKDSPAVHTLSRREAVQLIRELSNVCFLN